MIAKVELLQNILFLCFIVCLYLLSFLAFSFTRLQLQVSNWSSHGALYFWGTHCSRRPSRPHWSPPLWFWCWHPMDLIPCPYRFCVGIKWTLSVPIPVIWYQHQMNFIVQHSPPPHNYCCCCPCLCTHSIRGGKCCLWSRRGWPATQRDLHQI